MRYGFPMQVALVDKSQLLLLIRIFKKLIVTISCALLKYLFDNNFEQMYNDQL